MDPRDKSSGWTVVVPDGDGQEESAAGRALLFRLKSEEARTAARGMTDPGARQAMLQVAETYNRLARHVAERDASQEQRTSARDASQDAAQAQSND